MRFTLQVIIAVGLAAATLVAVAQDPEGEEGKGKEPTGPTRTVFGDQCPELVAESWANYEGKPTLDKFKNRIVVLFFFRTTDKSVDAIAALNDAYKKLAPLGVGFIALTPQKKEAAEAGLKGKDGKEGKEIKFPIGFGVKTDERYQVASFPKVYLIDTVGRLVNRFDPADGLEEKIRAQIAITPPIPTDSQALKALLEQAATVAKSKEYAKAYILVREISKLTDKDSETGKRAAELAKQIEEAAKKRLEEAKEAARSGDNDVAARILAELSVRFAGESVGAEADTEIGRLMGDNKLKPMLRKAIDNAKGQRVNDQAAAAEGAKRYLDALKLYREVTEQYADSEAGKAAEKAIERINTDPKIQDSIKALRADEEAERWLDLGDRFAKVELYSRARDFYQRIIASHPDARAASKAKERLGKLPEEKPEEEIPMPAAEEGEDTGG